MNKKKILISEDVLQSRINNLADQITNDYKDKELTVICILKGSMYFCADLTKRINLDTNIEFMRISSYDGCDSTGNIKVILDLDKSINGKDVLVVEDIIDTGKTLSYLLNYLSSKNPNSLKLCTLLDKPDRRETNDVIVDYVGFTIPNRFVIGYGLDLDEKYRSLPTIYCFTDDNDKELDNDIKNIEKQLIKTKKRS